MSVRVSGKVWELSGQTGDRLLLMLALADFASEDGRCWPSQPVLATKIRCSVRWVQKMLSELKKCGEIEVVNQGVGRGRNTEYQIVFCKQENTINGSSLEVEKTNVGSTNSTVLKGELCDIKPELHNTKGERYVRANRHRTVKNRQEPSGGDLKLPFESAEFSEAWQSWRKFKTEKGEKLPPSTVEFQLRKLQKMGEPTAIAAIQNSICCNYTGLFPPTEKPTNGTPQNPRYLGNLNKPGRYASKPKPAGAEPPVELPNLPPRTEAHA